MAEFGVCVVFERILVLAAATGVREIYRLDGCWEVELGDGWWIAVNGHDARVRCSRRAEVPPYHAYVEWNGLPAGLFDPAGGLLAAGAAANEAALIAALDAAIVAAAPKEPTDG